MVDVRRVIDVPNRDFVIDLNKAILFPCRWFKAQMGCSNLQITQSLDQLLSSGRVSDRLLGKLIVDVELRDTASWAYVWLVISLDDHAICGLRFAKGVCQCLSKYGDKQPRLIPNCYSYFTKEGKWTTNLNANEEFRLNDEMMRLFSRKYPIRIDKLTPMCGPLQCSVPVVEPRRSPSGRRRIASQPPAPRPTIDTSNIHR